SRLARRSISVGGPFGSQPFSSARDHCTRTGRPTAFASSAATTAASSWPLRPYQPHPAAYPQYTLSAGRLNSPESCLRRSWVPCEADHEVSLPSLNSATAQDGPIEPWVWIAKS